LCSVIPAIFELREFATAGGLMSYGASSPMDIAKPAFTPAEFSRALCRPICRSCSRPNLNW
jgi:hypothetical protein